MNAESNVELLIPEIPLISGAFFMTKGEVTIMTTLSSSSIDRLEDENRFPVRIPFGGQKKVWLASQVYDWCTLVIRLKSYPPKDYYSLKL